MFLNGDVFDSSEGKDPLRVSLAGGVIPGFLSALQRMTPGAKWRVFIPSDLAYGLNGSAPVIGPNQTLVFELEVLSVAK